MLSHQVGHLGKQRRMHTHIVIIQNPDVAPDQFRRISRHVGVAPADPPALAILQQRLYPIARRLFRQARPVQRQQRRPPVRACQHLNQRIVCCLLYGCWQGRNRYPHITRPLLFQRIRQRHLIALPGDQLHRCTAHRHRHIRRRNHYSHLTLPLRRKDLARIVMQARHPKVRRHLHTAAQAIRRKGHIPGVVFVRQPERNPLQHRTPDQRTAPPHARHPHHPGPPCLLQLSPVQAQTLPHVALVVVAQGIDHPQPMAQQVDAIHHVPRRIPQQLQRIRRRPHVVLYRHQPIVAARQRQFPGPPVLHNHVAQVAHRKRIVPPHLPL